MIANKINQTEGIFQTKEFEILSDIKDAEKKADELLKRAKDESDLILQEAARNSLKLLAEKQAELIKLNDKKMIDFREKLKLIKEGKDIEGKEISKQLKENSQKNIPKAVEVIMGKIEELI